MGPANLLSILCNPGPPCQTCSPPTHPVQQLLRMDQTNVLPSVLLFVLTSLPATPFPDCLGNAHMQDPPS